MPSDLKLQDTDRRQIVDEKWVCEFTGLSRASLKRKRKHEDPLYRFPEPFKYTTAKAAKNYWFIDEVYAYLKRLREARPAVPRTIVTAGDTAAHEADMSAE